MSSEQTPQPEPEPAQPPPEPPEEWEDPGKVVIEGDYGPWRDPGKPEQRGDPPAENKSL